MNVLRLSLHPDGLAARILTLAEWRHHVLNRLAHEIERSADPVLASLRDELEALPRPAGPRHRAASGQSQAIAMPLRLQSDAGSLSFLTTTTVFGTAVDVTLSEIAIEAFFPADKETADRMALLGQGTLMWTFAMSSDRLFRPALTTSAIHGLNVRKRHFSLQKGQTADSGNN